MPDTYILSTGNYEDGYFRGLFRGPTGLLPLWDGKYPLPKGPGLDGEARDAVRRRLGTKYFRQMYALQMDALGYAALAFPTYKQVFGDVLAADWLAMVDWRKFSRDHTVHQPLTAYAAKVLMGEGGHAAGLKMAGKPLITRICDIVLNRKETEYLREHFAALGVPRDLLRPSATTSKVWECIVETTAYIAGLFHDCGYPWAYRMRQGAELDRVAKVLSGESCVDEIFMELGSRLMMAPLLGYTRGESRVSAGTWKEHYRSLMEVGLRKTHGLPGGIAFCLMTDMCRAAGPMNPESAVKLACLEWAALAVVMHDMCGVYWGNDKKRISPLYPDLRLRAEVDPMSCLIALADQVQEFGRRNSAWEECPAAAGWDSNVKYGDRCCGTKLSWDEGAGTLCVTYLHKHADEWTDKRAEAPELTRTLFDPTHGFLDLTALGIKHVQVWADPE